MAMGFLILAGLGLAVIAVIIAFAAALNRK